MVYRRLICRILAAFDSEATMSPLTSPQVAIFAPLVAPPGPSNDMRLKSNVVIQKQVKRCRMAAVRWPATRLLPAMRVGASVPQDLSGKAARLRARRMKRCYHCFLLLPCPMQRPPLARERHYQQRNNASTGQ